MFNNIIVQEKIKNFQDKISVCQLKINPNNTIKGKKSSYQIEIYDQDVKITRVDQDVIKKKRRGGGLRKSISKFSKKSAKNLKFHMNNTKVRFRNMITLTYPNNYSADGKEIKYHFNRFTKFLKTFNCQYTWIIEFQKRGAPHFHLAVDKFINYKELSKVWYEIVGSGDEKHLKAGTQIKKLLVAKHGATSYFKKYAQKQEQKEVPEEYSNVGRFWGHSDTEYNKEVLEIDKEETLNIKAKYELFLRNVIKPKKEQELNFDWLYEGKNIILWNYRKQVLKELKSTG